MKKPKCLSCGNAKDAHPFLDAILKGTHMYKVLRQCMRMQYPSPLTTRERWALMAHAKWCWSGGMLDGYHVCPVDMGLREPTWGGFDECAAIAASLALDGTDGRLP